MLRHLVASWLREQAQQTLAQSLNPKGQAAEQSPMTCDLVAVLPSRVEASGLVDQLRNPTTTRCAGFVEHVGHLEKRAISLIEAPVAQDRLAGIVRDVIQLRKPQWLMSAGFAMALRDDVRKGDILMARRVMDDKGYSLQTGLQLEDSSLKATRGVHAGTLLSVTDLPSTMQAKKELAERHSAVGCDRQAAVIAEVCRLQQVPMLSVHTVAETLAEKSAIAVQHVKLQGSLAAKIGAAAGALIDQPSSVKQFWKEKETSLRLADRLAKFLIGMFQQLG